MEGLIVAPGYVRIEELGELRGVSISAFNHVKGSQNGLTIGIFNYAHSLRGLQLGVLNFAGNNRGWRRWLPLANWNFE